MSDRQPKADERESKGFTHFQLVTFFGRWHRRPMRYVYVLRCRGGELYIGETDDLASRVDRHNEGRGCVFTASRLPVSLAYAEEFATRDAALRRERQLKRWTRVKKEALIAGEKALLKRL